MLAAMLLAWLAAPASAQWSWEGCMGGPGLRVSSIAAWACGQREVNTLAAEWLRLEEGVREKVAAMASAAKRPVRDVGDKEQRLAGDAASQARGAPRGFAECLNTAAEVMRSVVTRAQTIERDLGKASSTCSEPLGDPDTEREALTCGEKVNDAWAEYNRLGISMEQIANRLRDNATCADPDDEPEIIAQYQNVMAQLADKQMEARDKMPKTWCDGSLCKVNLDPIKAYGERLKHFAAVIEPIPRALPVDDKRRGALVQPIKTAAAAFPRVPPPLEQGSSYNSTSIGIVDGTIAMIAVHNPIGVAYVKWKTWLCVLQNIPMSVCYKKKK